ncbi:caspase-7 [Polymixia lowei]
MLGWNGVRDRGTECNRAVLVSVAHFDYGVKLGSRPGAQKDTKRLHRTLSKLGFKVDIHNDLDSEEIYSLFQKVSRLPVKDCFLAVLSSHGEEGCVFGADGKPVRLSRIFSCFDNAHMEKKTKLFFIQACRGGDLDDGVEVDSAECDVTEDSFSQYLSVPVDTAVMYATAPGYGAFMHPLGAVFLQTLCALLEEEGGHNLELTRLLTRLSHRVAYTFQAKGRTLRGKKEMPCFLTRLTREVFPFGEPGKDTGAKELSATSLVGTENRRKRTPSIS